MGTAGGGSESIPGRGTIQGLVWLERGELEGGQEALKPKRASAGHPSRAFLHFSACSAAVLQFLGDVSHPGFRCVSGSGSLNTENGTCLFW